MKWIFYVLVAATGFAQSADKCTGLAKFQMPGATIEITSASMVAAGQARGGRGQAGSDAAGALPRERHRRQAHGSGWQDVRHSIRGVAARQLERRLPATRWRWPEWNRGEPIGNQAAGDKPALARGFAVATSDTGHQSTGGGFDGSFMQNQQAALDFEYVAIGRLTVLAKQIIAAYYGKPPAHSYYVGCSTGGREAMLMSQRYPLYFDGIVVGSPAMRTGHSNLATRTVTVALNSVAPKDASGKPEPALSDSEKKAFIAKLLDACDARDGTKDGMIFDPLGCSFTPKDLQCSGAKADDCLSPEQVAAIEKGFAGPKDSRGKQVYAGWFYDTGITAQGQGIPGLLNPGPSPVGRPVSATTQDVDAEAATVDNNPVSRIGDSYTWVNLDSFSSHGGKLIFYHGLSDPWFSAKDTIDYYNRMTAANGGASKVTDWSRLFLSPGMGHCGRRQRHAGQFRHAERRSQLGREEPGSRIGDGHRPGLPRAQPPAVRLSRACAIQRLGQSGRWRELLVPSVTTSEEKEDR